MTLFNEKLLLVKASNGEEIEFPRCNVQRNKIFSKSVTTPIANGDRLRRTLPSGVVEVYVIESFDLLGLGMSLAHYEITASKVG